MVRAVTEPSVKTTATATLASLTSYIAGDLAKVDEVIIQRLGSKADIILQMGEHLLFSGGKRLRPSLTLICSRLCGYTEGSRHINLAAAVELIHTATLLHDDVVDESSLRRGKETANNRWGNKASILVGDFLLGQSFRLMVDDGSIEVLRILSDASAVIAEGEVLQLLATNNLATSEALYTEIVSSKTAKLFAAACEIGAVIVDHGAASQSALESFGRSLGIAFQIMDDALDYSAKQEELGKTIGDDFREGKITLPIIHAYNKGEPKEKAFWERVIEQKRQEPQDLEQAINLIRKHHSLNYCIEVASQYVAKAQEALGHFPDSKEKTILLELLDFCIKRPY